MNICPVCGGDRNADLLAARELAYSLGLISESVNPGGRILLFSDQSRLQLHDQCSSCDAKAIAAKANVKGTTK